MTTDTDTQATMPVLAANDEGCTIGDDGRPWPHTFDANAWAIEFNKRFPSVSADHVLGWMANAMMRGFDEAARRMAPQIQNKLTPANVVAGALFDLMGFLTTRDTPVTLGASESSAPAVDLLLEFAANRDLPTNNAAVLDWTGHISPVAKPAGHVATMTINEVGGAELKFTQATELHAGAKFLVFVAPPDA